MALNIRNAQVEQLADELSRMTGESKTAVILHALEERRARLAPQRSPRSRLEQVIDFLEREVWPELPSDVAGRGISKRRREQILGYGRDGV
jgi:antitoxin VapB